MMKQVISWKQNNVQRTYCANMFSSVRPNFVEKTGLLDTTIDSLYGHSEPCDRRLRI